MADQPITVLLIEDSLSVARAMLSVLARARGAELRPVWADRLKTAIGHLATHAIDVILLDLALPDSRGLDTLSRVQAQAPGVPIVVLTGQHDETLGIEAVQRGAQDYLVKGEVDDQLLVRSLRYAIERTRAKAALRQSYGLLHAIIEGTPDAVFVKDRHGCYLTINSAGARFLGKQVDEVIGKDDTELFSPDTAHPIIEGDQHVLTSGETRTYEEIGTAAGITRTFLATKVPYRDDRGGIIGVIGIARDITERKRTEEALRKSEERFRLLVEGTKDHAIFMLDPQGHVASWNAGAERIMGYRADEIMGRHYSGFYPSEELEWRKPEDELRMVAAEGQIEAEGWRVHRDGTRFWANVVSTALHDEAGQLRGFSIVIRDITERKRAEEERTQLLVREQAARAEAEAANHAKDEFLAMVSQELRTPLAPILEGIDRLRTRTLDAASSARVLETIEHRARALAQLIDDLLDVSGIDTGKLRLEVRPVMLAPVADAALDAVRPAAEAKDIELRSVLDPLVGPVSGDPIRLQQVVWNLLSNAIKLTPAGGRVEVRLERGDSHARLTVSDTGQGIPAEFLPHVFERFRQSDGSGPGAPRGGLGLGLAIVRHVVELHGGTVTVDSRGAGQGAVFQVSLPLLDRHPEAGDPESMHPPDDDLPLPFASLRALDGVRVLVVDDDARSRESFPPVLEQWGADVLAVASAREALAAIERWRPDVLVSGLDPPGINGLPLIRQVRALGLDRGGGIPAVALTAPTRTQRREAASSGFQAQVPRTIEPAELAAVVADLAGWIVDRATEGR